MGYVAKTLLSHSVTGEIIKPGEPVDLSHLNQEQIQHLIEIGAVEEKPQKKKSKREDE